MPFIEAEGLSYHYLDFGEGPPLTLIAGLASDGASWGPVAEPLRAGRRLLIPDNRGAGRTRDDGAPLSIETHTGDLARFLDHLGVAQTDMLGHSMGGGIALAFAAAYPDRVRRLICAASPPKPPAHALAVMESLAALRAGTDEVAWLRQFFCWLFHPTLFEDPRAVDAAIALAMGYAHRQSPENFRRQLETVRAVDLFPVLAKIEAPTLILHGADDLLFSKSAFDGAFAGLRDATVRVMARAGHSLHWDQPAAFAAAVNEFLGAAS